MFQKGPGKTKASYQPKAEMESNKKKKVKKENVWTTDTNSDVSDSQLNDSNDSGGTETAYKYFNNHFKSVYLHSNSNTFIKLKYC